MRKVALAICLGVQAVPALAQYGEASAGDTPTVSLAVANDPYRPYEFLIGDWISQEGSSTLRQTFGWGPKRSYIRYSTYMRQPGGAERLHFEGIMVWNGNGRRLDFLFAVEPGTWTQERGNLHVGEDGAIVRDVELTDPNGRVSQFRQTIRRMGTDRAVTSLMRQTAKGWEPNFPGSDAIAMERRRL